MSDREFDRLPPELRALAQFNRHDVPVYKGRLKPPFGWLLSPARLEINASADRALTEVSRQRQMGDGRVDGVRAARFPGRRIIYIIPAHPADPQRIPVRRYGDTVSINLAGLLGGTGLTLPLGHRSRFDLVTADPPGIGPSLAFDLDFPLEKRLIPRFVRQQRARAAQRGG